MTKRAVATITVYVYGENSQEIFNEANKMTVLLNNQFDCRASVEQLNTAPFGGIGLSQTININKLKITNDEEF